MHTLDMINFRKLFELDDHNKLKDSLYENLSNNEKRVLYDEVTNQNKKLINVKSKALYYSIFAIIQILFLISMILLLVVAIKYNDNIAGTKFELFSVLPMLSLILTMSMLLVISIVYVYETTLLKIKTDDIDDFILMISGFSSLFLTFLMTKAIILFLQMINSVVATIKREINFNSRGVKDQANYYENKFIEYFHQSYYDKNKAAYFKHELIKNLYTCDNENVLKLDFLDKSINNNHLTDVEIDALNHLLYQQQERQLNFKRLITKLHQLNVLTLLKDSENHQIENEKALKLKYDQQKQYAKKVQHAMKQLKDNQLNNEEVIDQQLRNFSS